MADKQSRMESTIVSVLDNASRLQAPAVAKYVERVRRAHPDETPAQIVARMEKMFLRAVTGSGSAVGATAAVPAWARWRRSPVGAETAFFLEASHCSRSRSRPSRHLPRRHQQRRALVLAVALGESGMEIVEKATGITATNWARLVTGRIPSGTMKTMNTSLVRKFVTKYAAKRSALVLANSCRRCRRRHRRCGKPRDRTWCDRQCS